MEYTGTKYSVFKGNYRKEMAKLVAAGLQPATALDIAKLRVFDLNFEDILYDTSSGIAYSREGGKFKIIPYAPQLVEPNQSGITYGGTKLTDSEYASLPDQEFSLEDGVVNKGPQKLEAIERAPWLALFGGDKDLLENYTKFSVKNSPNPDGRIMNFYVGDISGIRRNYSQINPLLLYGSRGGFSAHIRYELYQHTHLVGLDK